MATETTEVKYAIKDGRIGRTTDFDIGVAPGSTLRRGLTQAKLWSTKSDALRRLADLLDDSPCYRACEVVPVEIKTETTRVRSLITEED